MLAAQVREALPFMDNDSVRRPEQPVFPGMMDSESEPPQLPASNDRQQFPRQAGTLSGRSTHSGGREPRSGNWLRTFDSMPPPELLPIRLPDVGATHAEGQPSKGDAPQLYADGDSAEGTPPEDGARRVLGASASRRGALLTQPSFGRREPGSAGGASDMPQQLQLLGSTRM